MVVGEQSEQIVEEMTLHLDSSFNTGAELDAYLSDIVEASGGRAGILTTWDDHGAADHTAVCGLDDSLSAALVRLTQEAACDVAAGKNQRLASLQHSLEDESHKVGLGPLHALTVPVVVQGRPVGMFCLLHPEKVPDFFRDSPRMYNLVVDHLEVVVNNAKLLQNLMRERLWFETLLTESRDGVAIVDAESQVVGVNRAMEELTGWKASEVVGHPVHEVFTIRSLSGTSRECSGGRREKAQHGLALYRTPAASSLPISAEPMEAELLDRQREPLPVEVTGLTVRDVNGRPCGWVMSVRDIRRRKEMERMGRVFLSAMSHELQTPIAVIKGFAGLMSDPEIDMPMATVREKAAVILDESERLLKMVRQMLEASSIEAGGISLKLEAVDMHEIVERTVRRLKPAAEQKKVKLIVKMSPELPPAWADPERLEQVVTNLVENAIKHGASGPVTVEVRARKSSLYVCVIDEGPGVQAEDQKRIFGLFQRGAETKVRGSGLGLFICQAIVRAHGGSIGVTAGPKGGACFYFTVPLEGE